MKVKILTLFPEMVSPVLDQSILKRAREGGSLQVEIIDIRDYSKKKHKQVDDTPYGGGAGMVMSPEPIFEIFDKLKSVEPFRIILTSPRGRPFHQEKARELSQETRTILFLCGHYEGMDERISQGFPVEEISIGDYVLTGGELPALVILDAVMRLVPGVLGSKESIREESFVSGLLEYPHYTRPPVFQGLEVPAVLLSGHHEAIRRWRLKESFRKTMKMRPDLAAKKILNKEESAIVREIEEEVNQTEVEIEKN
ncbi:MAG: tRNA (guanosine(37)-N1)-methyltransferase TrmD [Nitrospiria bacterium]